MKNETKNKKTRCITTSGLLLVGAVMVIAPVIPARAQPNLPNVVFHTLELDGYQPDSSSPLIVQGEPVGENAIWQRIVGPLLSDTFAEIPGASSPTTFNGAVCRAKYSQAQIVGKDGSTLTVNVYGLRCEPSAGGHLMNGIYTIEGGTGRFEDVLGGTGSIQIDERSDGSVVLRVAGRARHPRM